MVDALWLAARLTALTAAGAGYVWLLGAALSPWLLPASWRPYRAVALPFLGWAASVAVAHPLNAALPGRGVLVGMGVAAALSCGLRLVRSDRRLGRVRWGEAAGPLAIGGLSLVSPVALYASAGTLTSVVADSDVEHFADVVGAMLIYPIGWSLEAQMGLEATPIGLAYHYLHAAISALSGVDTFGTAVPSHLVMLALLPASVYVFSREVLQASPRAALLATALSACGGLALGVSAFGWGQQTAAMAAVPAGLAGVRRALVGGERRDILSGGLLAALAAGSLYLATAPLMGGTTVLAAALLARSHRARVLVRLVGLGAVVGSAGALSHLSTAGFFLLGGLSGGDVAGRSTHVGVFATLSEGLGVDVLPLFLTGERAPALLTGSATAATLTLGVAGLVRARRDELLASLALTTLAFALYLRVLRPFPYGEFKLLTTVWPVIAGLVATGCCALRSSRPTLTAVWGLCLGLSVIGLVLAHVQVRRGLAGAWGAALPESEMDALRSVVSGIPSGGAVWISNQLAPQAAVRWTGVETEARHGFTTREAGASYLAHRWRGAATALLALSGRPVFGLVRRHSTELRAPIEPQAADFVLLDESEDPLFLGLTDRDLIATAGRLRLFRAASGALPPALLPIGESLPGRRQGFTVPRRVTPPPAEESGEGFLAHAVWAAAETEVVLRTPTEARRVALFPGFTWLVTRQAQVRIEPTDGTDVRLLPGRALRPHAWSGGEALVRSPAGITSPAVVVTSADATTVVHYVNLSDRLVSTAARPHRSERVWIDGQPAGPRVILDPPTTRLQLAVGSTASTWLEIGPEGRAALHAPAGQGAFSLPLLGPPAARASLHEGDLVKGASARLHAVVNGRLRWVPTLEALQRRGPVPRLVTLRDEEVWRLPVDLPLE